jgi:hypothetical protein
MAPSSPDRQAAKLDLNLDVVGRYRWGSLVCDFPLAPAKARTAVEIVAAREADLLEFDSAATGRAVLSLMHEAVHYAQDLTTGVGHWDYVTRHRLVPRLLPWVQAVGAADPYLRLGRQILTSGAANKAFREYKAKLLFGDYADVQAREAPARAVLRAELGPAVDEADWIIGLDSILETEAMAAVLIEVLGRKMSAATEELLQELATLWDPGRMERKYRDLFAASFLGSGLASSKLSVRSRLLAQSEMISFTTDIALAYPPPILMTRRALDPQQLEPGVRFSRVSRALVAMSDSKAAGFLEHWRGRDLEACERILLSEVPVLYPSCREIYQAWVEELESLRDDDDDQVRAVRLEAARARATGRPIVTPKGVHRLIDLSCPLIVRGSQETQYLWQGLRAVDPRAQALYLADLSREERSTRLVDHYFADDPFICPLAEHKLCSAAQDECRNGWARLSALPARDLCAVRSGLEAAHLPMS